ncbi:MAG TPA: hypothetical protein DCR61_08025 [Verrucomicrobiales bacterium]|nr:hypothetical protein [Verrucomicrobiales bacterium]
MIVLEFLPHIASKESKYKLSNHEVLPTLYSSALRSTRVTLRQDQNMFYRCASFEAFNILFE